MKFILEFSSFELVNSTTTREPRLHNRFIMFSFFGKAIDLLCSFVHIGHTLKPKGKWCHDYSIWLFNFLKPI